ncbi:MAG: energy-coupling factor transport system ATP-binding protein [Chloroflexota bacterium]|nr:energy-coupling factor transport system ATP-binding protein [Chloroflexota bacterium]
MAERIELRGWGWRHPGRRAWAVRGLDLAIGDGESVLLAGPSGSGKSTVLLGIAGLLDRSGGGESEGTLRVDGRTGVVFQDPETQLVMARAGDDVAFGLENRCVPAAEIWPRVHASLASVGFPYPDDHPTSALSGGEKQRLAFAGVMAIAPDILLLDEPTANLDADGARLVRGLIARERERGRTIVLVDHDVEAARPLVDRIIELAAVPAVAIPGDGPRADAGAPLVIARDAAFRYPAADHLALDGIDVEVRAGEAVALTGRNGSGKSTLALLLAGLLRPARGSVVAADGAALATLPASALVRRIGTVFQDPEHQFVRGRADDELMVGPLRTGASRDAARARAAELLARLRLTPLAAANPFTLSGGEQRRLSVATALATDPPLLVLDEPTFGQDRATYAELLVLLRAARDGGRGIVFATHDRALVTALADREVRLEAGRAA